MLGTKEPCIGASANCAARKLFLSILPIRYLLHIVTNAGGATSGT